MPVAVKDTPFYAPEQQLNFTIVYLAIAPEQQLKFTIVYLANFSAQIPIAHSRLNFRQVYKKIMQIILKLGVRTTNENT